MTKQDIIEKIKGLKGKYQIFLAFWLSNKSASHSTIQKGYYTEDNLLNDLRRDFNKKFPKVSNKKVSKLWKKFKKRLEKDGFSVMQHLKYHEIVNEDELFDIFQCEIVDEVVKEIASINSNELLVQIYFFLTKYNSLLSHPHRISNNFIGNFRNEFENMYDIKISPNIDTLLIQTGLLFQSTYIGSRNQYREILYHVPEYYILVIHDILKIKYFRSRTFLDFIRSKQNPRIQEGKKIYCGNCGKELEKSPDITICFECGSEIRDIDYALCKFPL